MEAPFFSLDEVCKIIGFDRPKRLNEYVASGFFPCAPKTVSGRSRMFALKDLLALRCFRFLLDRSLSPNVAGEAACEIAAFTLEHLDKNPQFVGLIVPSVGSPFPLLLTEVPDDGRYDERDIEGMIFVNVGLYLDQNEKLATHFSNEAPSHADEVASMMGGAEPPYEARRKAKYEQRDAERRAVEKRRED